MNRRQALLSSGIAATGLLTANSNNTFAATNKKRGETSKADHRFKFSLAAYSYRNLLSGSSPQLSLSDFIDDCAKFGLDGTELTSYYFPKKPEKDLFYKLKGHAFRQGLDVSGTAIGNDFGHADPAKRSAEIGHTKRWVDYAEMMGTSVIRIFAGHQKKGVSAEKSHQLMVSAIEECCEYAGAHGVHLALENHGGPTATAEGLLKFVNDVKSDWFGVNLDTGNFHTEDVYGDLEKVAPHAINVQVKVAVSGPDRKKQPADFQRVGNILKESKYRGYVVLEFEEKGDPRSECPKYLDQLREALG